MESSKTDSLFINNLKYRNHAHKPNPHLGALVKELSDLLQHAEATAVDQFRKPAKPVLFVVGNPRSGTTLTMQFLASTGNFSYPTNLLARFSSTPYIGAKIQLLLTDPLYKFHNELSEFDHPIDFLSIIGKTRGALAPNEFYHFWRRFTPNYDPQYLTTNMLENVDWKGLSAGIAAIEAVFQKPFAAKALLLQYNLTVIHHFFKKVLFLYVKRNPFYVIQSLLKTREKFYGSRSVWYSVKPPEYEQLKKMDPFHQVAGQVFFTDRSIQSELSVMDNTNKLCVDYLQLCENPQILFNEVREKIARMGFDFDSDYYGPQCFTPSDQIRLPEKDCHNIIQAYKKISGINISP